ncbi:MAG: TRAP transporter substrate-binding protein [Cyclobacteriaceae bacterium]|nr:TRAP transporter substrate-binding protein [Cyclobacteriaceae bacterium]MCK5368066.1 TRAP transporter substrate-binding protein [Cyclobacteriaceae bacterium]
MKTPKLSKILTVVYFSVIISFFSSCNSNNSSIILRFGHQANESDIWHKSSLKFKELVEELSEGRIEVRVYPAEQLGKERDMIRSIKAGIVDMTTTGESMQNWSKITVFCAVPYLIKNSDHLKKVVDGPVGQRISAEMIKNIGLRPIAYFERGARNLTSNRPISTPEDLKGIILRVPNVPIFVKTWTELGAKPTPMTLSEVFTALQQGTVEAQENPYALINSAGFYEVQKYVNLTEHVIGWVYVVIGEEKFQSLPVDLQEVIINAGKLTQEYHQKIFKAEEKYLREELERKGMIIQTVDKVAFQEKASRAVKESLPGELIEVYENIEKLN